MSRSATTTSSLFDKRIAPIDEWRQFWALYRNFLFRVIDLELLSVSGEIRNLLAQFAALLAAYSFVLAIATVSYFSQSSASHSKLVVSAWSTEEFLISTTLTVAGLFAVLAWNAVLPDRRDSLILDPLPLRTRTVSAAKCTAIAVALAISILSVNVFTGISIPFLVTPPNSGFIGAVRCFFAYWITMAAAGSFVFISILALQNAAAAVLSYRLFQRVSGLLQLLAFFVILALFFLTPPLATPSALSSPANAHLLLWLPSFWFLGFFHQVIGTAYPVFSVLSARAICSLAAVSLFTIITAALTYRRTTRRIIEQPDIPPGEARGILSKLASAVTSRIFSDPLDRAIFLFSARTLARSRQHRLMLAVFLGLAFAISLAYAKSLLYGTSHASFNKPTAPLFITSLVTLFLAVVGSRAVFALPFALPANWVFRTTAVRSPSSYFSAIRKTLFTLAALPVLLASAAIYLSIWPGRPALEHLLVLSLLSILLVQALLHKFRKIPFACSYLPGKSNLKLKLGLAGFLFLFAVEIGAQVEQWSMQKPARYLALLALLFIATIWATKRTTIFSGSPYNRVQFEDAPAAEIYALDLRRDSDYINNGDYLDAVSSPAPRSLASKARLFALGSILLIAAGISYERFCEWRDHRNIPQVGWSVDLGGRSLNLYCSGYGSPTVVMDSGAGVPGYGWKLVQSGVAKLTRACWYDRAGYGWSDPAPRARSAADVAVDLHRLLQAGGISPPFLLVGHSLGGFHVRVFAALYPSEVCGLVLVDSADEYEDASRLPKSIQSPVSRYIPKRLIPIVGQLARFCFHAGLVRLFDNGIAGPDGQLSLSDTLIIHSLQLQSKEFDASLNEGLSRRQTLAQVRAIRSLGAIPLIVLSGAKKPAVPLDDESEVELMDQFMDRRLHVTQAHLATLSSRGHQIILENVGHDIPTQDQDAIKNAVRDLLRER